ncbi:amino acid kinase family-domain-containing protein, partial [Jimgerdemannia flammicorona]
MERKRARLSGATFREMSPSPTPTVVVKIGGAALTNKLIPCALAPEESLAAIASQIHTAYLLLKQRGQRLILVHGAGSFGHPQAKSHGLSSSGIPAGLPTECREFKVRGAVETRRALLNLHNKVLELLSARDVPVISLPSFNLVKTTGGVAMTQPSAFAPVVRAVRDALDAGFVPLLHGDLVMDETRGFAILSSDIILERLAQALQVAPGDSGFGDADGYGYVVERCVFLTDVEGVYDRDPKKPAGPNGGELARLINRIGVSKVNDGDVPAPAPSPSSVLTEGKVGETEGLDGEESEEDAKVVADVTGLMPGKVAVARRVLLDMVDARVALGADVTEKNQVAVKVIICKAGSQGAWEAITGNLDDVNEAVRMTVVEL